MSFLMPAVVCIAHGVLIASDGGVLIARDSLYRC